MSRYSKNAKKIAEKYESIYQLALDSDSPFPNQFAESKIGQYLRIINEINEMSCNSSVSRMDPIERRLTQSVISITFGKLVKNYLMLRDFKSERLSDEKQALQLILEQFNPAAVYSSLLEKRGIKVDDHHGNFSKSLNGASKYFANIPKANREEAESVMACLGRFVDKNTLQKCYNRNKSNLNERLATFSNPEGYRVRKKEELIENMQYMETLFDIAVESSNKHYIDPLEQPSSIQQFEDFKSIQYHTETKQEPERKPGLLSRLGKRLKDRNNRD